MLQINKQNNFGFLRLFFAILVIFSHSPESIDGNRSREPMARIFGNMSMGDLAVNCFFMISGFLILMSYQHSSSFNVYLKKRILRIYPGFILAYLFCLFCIVPLAKDIQMLLNFDYWFWIKSVFRMLTLQAPWISGVFHTPYSYINGPMWTIKYEFLCYLILPMISYFFKNNLKLYVYLFLFSLSLFFLFGLFNISLTTPKPFDFESGVFLRLFSAYLIGNIFYLAREKIVFDSKYTILSILILLGLLFNKQFAHIALITCGAYLLFNFALNYKSKFLNKIGTKTDLSYGIYLYAWPIQNLIIQNNPTINPLTLSLMVLSIAAVLALISWTLVEKPFMNMKNSLSQTALSRTS